MQITIRDVPGEVRDELADASVLVAATIDSGPEGAWAEDLMSQGNLVAPDPALVEATNILRRLEAAGQLERIEAGSAARNLLQLDLDLVPFAPFADRVWELGHNLTSYDAGYVGPSPRSSTSPWPPSTTA